MAGVAAAGAILLVLQASVAHEAATAQREGGGASWAWLVTFVGVPVIALIGAAAAPRRVRAVVVAALAADAAAVFVSKGMTIIRLGSVGRQVLAWQLAVVALTIVAARAGSRWGSGPEAADLIGT